MSSAAATKTGTIYVNGVAGAAPIVMTKDRAAGLASKIYIGHHPGTSGSDVYIDEVGVWSRVLTTEEIAEIRASGAGKFYPYE